MKSHLHFWISILSYRKASHSLSGNRATACQNLTVFVTLVLCTATNLLAQPAIEWEKAFGGTGTDELFSVQQTSDGGYVLGGTSNTNQNGDRTEPSFEFYEDYWILKLDSTGKKEWDKAYGSDHGGDLISLRQTPDGGYIAGGAVNSGIGRDKTVERKGIGDFWIIKMAADGSKEWDKSYGGSNGQSLNSLELTSDGGYLLAGRSYSNAGIDKSEDSRGGSDYWIIKTDAAGNKQWDVTLGGTADEELGEAKQVSDGGYLISGSSTSSASGDKTESSKGSSDYWIVKLRADGTKEWDKTIGGASLDFNCKFLETNDQGYLLGGISWSGISGDKTEIGKGSGDYWVVKIDSKGLVQWDKSFGSTGYDWFISMVQARDGGYILAGQSAGPVGVDKSEPPRNDDDEYQDFWLVKIAENGNKIWDKTIGSAGTDLLNTIANTDDGGIIVGGSSSGSGFERSQPMKGNSDYWFVKFAPENSLPVTLTSFTAQKESQTAVLSWQTTLETRSDRFEVQHSTNGKVWNTLATVNAKGESSALQSYQYVHTSPAAGDNLYRLKMVDMAGTFAFSKIEVLHFAVDKLFKVFPNPVAESLMIEMTDWQKVRSIELLSSQSAVVYHSGEKPASNINIKALPGGLYFIRITLTDGTSSVRKVIIGK